MTDNDIILIKTRECKENDVPKNTIHLFRENYLVDQYNENQINEYPGKIYVSEAIDNIY